MMPLHLQKSFDQKRAYRHRHPIAMKETVVFGWLLLVRDIEAAVDFESHKNTE
jgi:hypothetical protein